MHQQCRWFSHVEDVRAHQLDHVLWYKHGYERGPLIFPGEYPPSGPFTRMGTIEELLTAMQQALASDAGLHRAMEHRGGIIIHAHLNEQGTTYRFYPVPAGGFSP